MPRNVEIKARVADMEKLKSLAAALADDGKGICLKQHDTFFISPQGRLKLRVVNDLSELIFYDRPDAVGPKTSNYHITRNITEPNELRKTLELSMGIRGSVKKERWLYMIGQTRVHCDTVEDLGTYMELEVVLSDSETPEQGMAIAEGIMGKLGVSKDNLVSGAYMDMLDANKISK